MKVTFTALSLLFSAALFAQTTAPADTSYWRIGGTSSLTFSQVSLTNWAAGGQNSVAINSNFSIFANRVKGRGKWENSMDLAYGLIKQGEGSFIKSDDLINIVTKYGYQIDKENGKWFYSALLDFRSQFWEGLDAETNQIKISDFLAPGYITIALGISYDPNDKLSFSYSPLTGKFTIVTDQELADAGAYGVDPGSKSRAEFGSFFRAKYKNDVFESKLELFTGYTESVGEIDVNWQNALVLPITKVLSTNLYTQLIYDKDILIADDEGNLDDRVQFKNVLGIGLTYQFGQQKAE